MLPLSYSWLLLSVADACGYDLAALTLFELYTIGTGNPYASVTAWVPPPSVPANPFASIEGVASALVP